MRMDGFFVKNVDDKEVYFKKMENTEGVRDDATCRNTQDCKKPTKAEQKQG